MSTLLTQGNNDSMNYSSSQLVSPQYQIYSKTYNNIKINYCKLTKKKIPYANPTKQRKQIRIESLNKNNIKIKQQSLRIEPYNSGQIQLRIFYDHTYKKNQEAVIRIYDGNVIEQLKFNFVLVQVEYDKAA